MTTITPCQTAQQAIDAAKKAYKYHWSQYILRSYCRNRNIPVNVLRAARYCEALKNAGLI